jgi:hypothetical protein
VFAQISPQAVFWVAGGLISVALIFAVILLTQPMPPLRSRVQPETARGD